MRFSRSLGVVIVTALEGGHGRGRGCGGLRLLGGGRPGETKLMRLTWHGQRGRRALCRVTVETEVGGLPGEGLWFPPSGQCGRHWQSRSVY